MTLSSFPIWIVDVAGSVLMIFLAFQCLSLSRKLKRRDPDNVIWIYLHWVCGALLIFAVSRSAGHLLKQLLIIGNFPEVWHAISPYSGAINTVTFVLVASLTLFFESIWEIYLRVFSDKRALQSAHGKLLYLNQNLENLVTERTAALALSEQKYRRIFEVSRDMILVTDKGGRILSINPAGCRMLGYDERRSFPKAVSVRDHFAKGEEWDQVMEALTAEGVVHNAEVDLFRLSESAMRALVSGIFDRSAEGFGETIHFVVKDIEQRRRLNEKMARAEKLAAVGELSAGFAHEINNPLGIILGYTQLLLREEPEGTQRSGDLKTIEKHVKNCKEIVADLLNFSRSSAPQMGPVDINAETEEVAGFIRSRSDTGNIAIETDCDPRLPPVLADGKKIRQVLLNLVMNARHAVGEKGVITLSTGYNGEAKEVHIRVKDTGTGIAKENLSRIFDPFFTTKKAGEGTGLGLSVSYGIVRAHGGFISVESKGGKGSVFTVVLPHKT